MNSWEPTPEQWADWETRGYFVIRNAIPRDSAIEMRGVIKDLLLRPEPEVKVDDDPMDPMGDTPQARSARFRKLSNFCTRLPLIWHHFYCSEAMTSVARYFLGDTFFLKYNSCFVKPARTGSATPWHQDNGLWRDGETEPFNFWMALDPATTANGCLQFIPGSHKLGIFPHLLYDDSIHAELPREEVQKLIADRGTQQCELDSGDVVCWHSSICHYSPPNPSPRGRIAIAGVYSTPQITRRRKLPKHFYWVLRNGEPCTAFPPQQVDISEISGRAPVPAAEETPAPAG
ncbi:MAG: phytanoyl-CoA dioxygenase family protein [Caldilineaceae bacterium]|nr:phytanoyl-CoA dioxygenase family protein [Caldilineaceae bacterium]